MTLSKTNICQHFCLSLVAILTEKSLVSPTPPGEHTLQQYIDALRGHYCLKPLVIVERFRFMKRRLLAEKDLTYTKAREIATSMEIASRDSK